MVKIHAISAARIEFELFNWKEEETELLKQCGCFEAIINWQLRMFVPFSDAAKVISKLQST